MTSLMTASGSQSLTYLRTVAASPRGRVQLQNMLSDYMRQRDQLPPYDRRTRDIAAARVRHALREAITPVQPAPAPTSGTAA